jgi:hypothetical protein
MGREGGGRRRQTAWHTEHEQSTRSTQKKPLLFKGRSSPGINNLFGLARRSPSLKGRGGETRSCGSDMHKGGVASLLHTKKEASTRASGGVYQTNARSLIGDNWATQSFGLREEPRHLRPTDDHNIQHPRRGAETWPPICQITHRDQGRRSFRKGQPG